MANELSGDVYELSFYCSMNQSYHQKMCFWYGFTDRGLKILVGLLAVLSLVTSSGVWTSWSFAISLIALMFAIALNILPLDRWERIHWDLFRRWTDLRKRVDRLDFAMRREPPPTTDPAKTAQRLSEERHQIELDEPAPWRWLLTRCQEEENQRRWGLGIRTNRDVESEKFRRQGPSAA